MKRKLPGRGSGIGACGRTLSLLSSDPCHAALPRTLRASRAPGTDPARNGCSSAPPQPPRLQRRLRLEGTSLLPPPPPGGLWSSLQAELQVREPEASVPRVSGCRKLEELLLPLCPPKAREIGAPLLSAPGRGWSRFTVSWRIARVPGAASLRSSRRGAWWPGLRRP